MIISVKRYGRYYNVDCKAGETPKRALERAVRLKKLGKDYSGPVEAKKALPKVTKKIEVKKATQNKKSFLDYVNKKKKK